MSRFCRIGGGLTTILLALLLLAACGGAAATPQAQRPAPTPSPTSARGARLLAVSAHKLNTATTLHGVFDVTFSGPSFNGRMRNEVWNATTNHNRTAVLLSTLAQFPAGSLSVSDGKQIWQYDPAQKVVYTGPVGGVSGGQSQLVLSIVRAVFNHSSATLVSAGAAVNGRPANELFVESQGQSASNASGGIASFSYSGDVYIDKKTDLPLRLSLTLLGFGQVQIDLPALALNQPAPAGTFTFVVPPGVRVLPLRQASPTTTTGSMTLAQADQQAGYHLLSIPGSQTLYQLTSVNALGAPGSQVYTLNYSRRGTAITLAEGKPLANLPFSGGRRVSVRGTDGSIAVSGSSTSLDWTEHGVGISITAVLGGEQLLAIAKILA